MLPMKALHGACNGQAKQYVDDVFSTYLYTGNGSTQTINNGIDLAGEGGMVWIKNRLSAPGNQHHALYDTQRGVNNRLISNLTNQQDTDASFLSAFNSNGFSLAGLQNDSGGSFVSWTFRRAPKFFDVQTKSHTNGTASTVYLSALGTVGMVTVKATSTTSNWYTWHRSLTAGNNLKLNLADAQSATNAYLSVSGTTLTIASTAPTATYVVYGFAHDTDPDGIIQCGSFTADASGIVPPTALGWEPQFILYKDTNGTNSWRMYDTMRGWVAPPSGFANDAEVYPNTSGAESLNPAAVDPTATGLSGNNGLPADRNYVYMAIRRPNKPPTSGTQVFTSDVFTSSGTGSITRTIEFPPDFSIEKPRSNAGNWISGNRLTEWNKAALFTALSNAEADYSTMEGVVAQGANQNSYTFKQYYAATSYLNYMFRRAPGVFDVVCYTGTGVARTVPHGLGVAPELMIVKRRDSTTNGAWQVYHKDLGATQAIVLNSNGTPAAFIDYWNNTAPTPSVFTVGTYWTGTTVAYLFASLPGISKVGSYTGNGSSQNINCGFSTGARFILIKATSTTGSWWIYDSVRGIIAANDPALQLNYTAAEITTSDAVDPDSSGFIVNQEATCSINANGVSYVFLAIS